MSVVHDCNACHADVPGMFPDSEYGDTYNRWTAAVVKGDFGIFLAKCPASYCQSAFDGDRREYLRTNPLDIPQPISTVAPDTVTALAIREQQQLQAQAAMLGSPTAVWGSGAAYTAQVADTTAETKTFNTDVAKLLGAPQTAQTATVQTPQQASQPAAQGTPGNTNTILIGAGVAVAALAAIYFIWRKK